MKVGVTILVLDKADFRGRKLCVYLTEHQNT